jgi:hypothetical protein
LAPKLKAKKNITNKSSGTRCAIAAANAILASALKWSKMDAYPDNA